MGLYKASGRNTLRSDSKGSKVILGLMRAWSTYFAGQAGPDFKGTWKLQVLDTMENCSLQMTYWAQSRGGGCRLMPGDSARERNQAPSALAVPPPGTPQNPLCRHCRSLGGKAATHSSQVAGGARRPTDTISRTFPIGSLMENIILSYSESLNSLAVKRSQKSNIKQRPGFKCSRMWPWSQQIT